MRHKLPVLISFLFFSFSIVAQTGSLSGSISTSMEEGAFATVQISSLELGTTANLHGYYTLDKIPYGTYEISVSLLGYETQVQPITINKKQQTLDVALQKAHLLLEQVVITGTKTFKRQTDSPVIVNVIGSETLNQVQACNLSEGLKFQPGLRVETDCQTCNYTQLRMNGLGGGYSQILINGRPIFSPLTGLYGMEQIPVNMIDRIETVRGGGSALYGSSAVGGTVNVITKIPKESAYDINYTYQNINGGATDKILSGNATVLTHKEQAGASFFINNRERELYDHNDDNFSELPSLSNTSFGTNLFLLPTANQKIELSISKLHEYRFGGEMVNKPAYLTQQSEERTHDVLMGSLDYQINFNNDNSSFIFYAAGQQTDRLHYTGIIPDDSLAIQQHIEAPPYGTSATTTLQAGTQLNHRFEKFIQGSNVITFGAEYIVDDVLDVIDSYQYKIDQLTKNAGAFVQSDWELTPSFNILAGVRADKHNLVDNIILSPRVSLLYKYKSNTQFRLTWGSGFRAPQAFDTDLHIAFAGGGISRISLSEDLAAERSQSFSGSINFDKPTDKYIFGFTVEGFYTHLDKAFYLQPLGEDNFGELFEKRNGSGATVQGATLELRANYNKKAQIETGFTLQSSLFDEAVENIEGLPASKKFLRTPNDYGFATLTLTPTPRFTAAFNVVYTGQMDLVHFAGAPQQLEDEQLTSESFTEVGLKLSYNTPLPKLDTNIAFFGGIKNAFNAYQDDFDTGKNRDSNYVYGPSMPRTFFIGIRFYSL